MQQVCSELQLSVMEVSRALKLVSQGVSYYKIYQKNNSIINYLNGKNIFKYPIQLLAFIVSKNPQCYLLAQGIMRIVGLYFFKWKIPSSERIKRGVERNVVMGRFQMRCKNFNNAFIRKEFHMISFV